MAAMPRSFLPWLAASLAVLIGIVLWTRAQPAVGTIELSVGAEVSTPGIPLELASAAAAESLRTPSVEDAPREPLLPASAPVELAQVEFEVRVLRAEDDTQCAAPGSDIDVRGAPNFVAKPASWEGRRFAWHVEIRGSEPACLHVVVGDLVLASQPIDRATRDQSLPVGAQVVAAGRDAAEIALRVVTDPQTDLEDY